MAVNMLFPVTARGLMSIYQSYHKSLCLKVTYTRRYKISGAKCEAFIVICKSEEVVKKKKKTPQVHSESHHAPGFLDFFPCENVNNLSHLQ